MTNHERQSEFDRITSDEFAKPIDRSKVRSIDAFDAVSGWDGKYPGVFAFGQAGTGKTRACWSALRRLYCDEQRSFRWWTGRRLSDDYYGDFRDGDPDAFWHRLRYHRAFFVDDLDKFDLSQERSAGFLFELADRIYRDHLPFLVTSNHSRDWWRKALGEAFIRRMFDEATRPVQF
jgi:DNA replication protein DnaC